MGEGGCGGGGAACGAEVVAESVVTGRVFKSSETATVLVGWAAGDCPEAEVGKNVTDVNANATEALMNARGIDT